jgi:hypothetical protein
MIEKNIHFIWDKGYEKMPEEYKENFKSWKNLHPHWKFYFWDKPKMDALMQQHYPEFKEMWENCSHIVQNVDMAKLMILHRHGGVYVDTDIKCVRTYPEEFLKPELVVSHMTTKDFCPKDYACLPVLLMTGFSSSKEMLNNGFYAGKKNSPMLYDLLDGIKKARDVEPKWLGQEFYITATGGPMYLTKKYLENDWKNDPRVLVLDPEYIEPCGLKYGMTKDPNDCYVKSNTFGIHKHQLSWATPLMKLGMKIYYYRRAVFRVVAIITFLLFVWAYGIYGWNWLTIGLIFVFLVSLCCMDYFSP